MSRQLSIVVPAFDEAARLPATLERILGHYAGSSELLEVLIADDGSRDGTLEVAEAFARRDPRVRVLSADRHRGKGAAVRQGILASRGEFVLFSDADLATPIEDAEALWAAIEAGASVAIGSRAVPGAEVVKLQPWYRKASGPVLRGLLRLLGLGGIRDTQCGFKLFDGAVARQLFAMQRVEGFAFDLETLYLARREGLRIDEVPVRWFDNDDSRVRFFRDSARLLFDMVRIRLGRYPEPRPAAQPDRAAAG